MSMEKARHLAGALLLLAALGGRAHAAEIPLTVTRNSGTIPPHEVFELTFQCTGQPLPNRNDVQVGLVLTSPSGKEARLGGFFYGSSEGITIQPGEAGPEGWRKSTTYAVGKPDLWKARFAPGELGEWKYRYTFTVKGGESAGAGSFACVNDRAVHRGFIRPDPANPMEWLYDDGTPFFGLGLQDGWGDGFGTGSWLASAALEGPFRLDRRLPPPPPGAMFQPGPSSGPVNGEVYFRRYGRCGFNLFRCWVNGGVGVQQGIMMDELLRTVRKHGFSIMMGNLVQGGSPTEEQFAANPAIGAGQERFFQYCVNRWGGYVDVWEFQNENSNSLGKWLQANAEYLRSVDPYAHPITTSYERPEVPGIDVSSPHWYIWVDPLPYADQTIIKRAAKPRAFNKPIIVGEAGNGVDRDASKRPPTLGGTWDPESALRMRIWNWTALFNQASIIYWNTSYARDGHSMNLWIGPREREYARASQDFAFRLGKGIQPATVTLSEPKLARGYGMASAERAGVYLVNARDRKTPVQGLRIAFDVPRAARGYWYSTENAAILQRLDVAAGTQTLAVPDFDLDIALLITPDGPPDIDHDGIANDQDPDDDNDGVPDVKDAFPLEPEEWGDRDGDLIGDFLDADDDPADGVGDDKNKNGMPDCREQDLDGDGVPMSKAVPFDAFPWDPKEWADMDGDGVGDNSDPDIDGDGYTNAEERKAGTNPRDKISYPTR